LVATIGGMAAALAAKSTTVPFISLAGGTYDFYRLPTANFLGGLNLNSLTNDITYLQYLQSLGFSKAEVGILFNTNSINYTQEYNIFFYAEGVAIDQNTSAATALQLYTYAFSQFPNNVKAVIISADPFFSQTAQQLVQAANGSSFCILYPSAVYGNYSPSHYILYPPQYPLSQLCQTMGQIAQAVVMGQPQNYGTIKLGSPTNHCTS
jgi:hypothetical protein